MILSIILLCFAVLLILNILSSSNIQPNKNFKEESIKTLVRQAARWAMAAAQDKSILIAVLHANYAAGYLWALRDIATDEEIKLATNIDVIKFRDEITKVQDMTTKRLAQLCPNFAPDKSYLAEIGGEL